MIIKFLGSGGAFTPETENYNSNILIYDDKKDYLLFDAGFDIKNSLNKAKISPIEINKIFISHLHGDHCGGIEYIAFKQMFDSLSKKKIQLISDKNILIKGWKQSWSGTMEDLNTKATLETYFDTLYLDEKKYFEHSNTIFHLVENTHVVSDGLKIPSYGLSFIASKKVYISGDTSFELKKLQQYFNYDIIFHECSFSESKSPVHTGFSELCTLPIEVKNKIWLYHYSLENNTFKELNAKAKRQGFAGMVTVGQSFTI